MDVVHDNEPLDVVKYITTQLPQDLLQLIAVRDELATRQGALSAVNDIAALKDQATLALASARADSAEMLTDAQAKLSAAKAAQDALSLREEALNRREEAFDSSSAQTAKDQNALAVALLAREASATAREEQLALATAELASAQKTLAARVAAFQEKVAALTA